MDVKEPIRKRIVINIDQPLGQGASRSQKSNAIRSRRWPKVVAFVSAFLIVVCLIAVVGAYLWWRHYQTTPAYSIAIIVDAAQRDDLTTFNKHVDDDAIAQNMVTNVGQKVAGRYGAALSDSLRKEVEALLPTLQQRLKQTIHEEIAKEIKDFASRSQPRPFIVVALAVPSFVNITTSGDSAKAAAKLGDRAIELGLSRDGDRWKVVDFHDDVLTQRVVDNIIKDLPAIGGLNSENTPKPKKRRNKR